MRETIDNLQDLNQKIESAVKVIDLDKLKHQLLQLDSLMQEQGFWDNQEKATKISKQASDIKSEIEAWEKLQQKTNNVLDLAKEDEKNLDVNLRQEIDKEYKKLLAEYEERERDLYLSDEHDKGNAIVSIFAGAGGDDAQDWAEMLSRMYFRFFEKQGFKSEIIDSTKGGEVGIKSITMKVRGKFAFGYLQSEHGVHRLVRLSPFDADHARHTSFALVEVLPEIDEVERESIDEKDLRIDTFMSSGKGGQSVNTTYSAVRIVHLPTNITVSCQNERSQLQNKETAMKILSAKLYRLKQEQRKEKIQDLKGEYKEAAWGNQIRSYVLHPYKMVKDLRTGYETQDTEKILDGELMDMIDAYLQWKRK